MIIRPAEPEDATAEPRVEGAAFGRVEPAGVVAALLEDPTAARRVSLFAELDGTPIGQSEAPDPMAIRDLGLTYGTGPKGYGRGQ